MISGGGKGDKVLLVKMTKINTNIEWQKRTSSEGYFQSICFLGCVPRTSGKTEFPPHRLKVSQLSGVSSRDGLPPPDTSSLWSVNLCANSPQPYKPRGVGGTGGMVVWPSELHSLHAIGSGPLWQPITHCSHVVQARVVLELRVGEQQRLLALLVW